MTDLKYHIRGKVHFRFYRDGQLWYETDSGFKFPVPVSDVGTATFLRDDKAMLFLRYIRQFMEISASEKDG